MEASKMLISTGFSTTIAFALLVMCMGSVFILKHSGGERKLSIIACVILALALLQLIVTPRVGIATKGEVVSVDNGQVIVRTTMRDYLLAISQGEFLDIRTGDIVRFDDVRSPEGGIKYQIVSIERKIE